MNKLVKSSIAVIIALGLGTPLVASGATPAEDEARSVKVNFADLDIENKAGARVLYARLQQASKQACNVSPYTQDRSLGSLAESKACYKGTLEKAVSKIDSRALSELHAS